MRGLICQSSGTQSNAYLIRRRSEIHRFFRAITDSVMRDTPDRRSPQNAIQSLSGACPDGVRHTATEPSNANICAASKPATGTRYQSPQALPLPATERPPDAHREPQRHTRRQSHATGHTPYSQRITDVLHVRPQGPQDRGRSHGQPALLVRKPNFEKRAQTAQQPANPTARRSYAGCSPVSFLKQMFRSVKSAA